MNCDIERWKSFDVNGDDFAYSDILHFDLQIIGPRPERAQRGSRRFLAERLELRAEKYLRTEDREIDLGP